MTLSTEISNSTLHKICRRLGLAVCIAALVPPAIAVPPRFGGGTGAFLSGNHGPQGYLGIALRDVTEENVSALHLREARGAEIIRVDHDGPAGKMGLREHDVVLQMNGTLVQGEEPLRRMLHESAPGRTILLLISRDGQQLSVSGQMADYGEVERQAWEQHLTPANTPGGPQAPTTGLPTGDTSFAPSTGASSSPTSAGKYGKSFLGTFMMSPTYTGAMLEVMGPQLAEFFAVPGGSGLLVRSVAVNSPAAMAGLKAGDIVVKANALPVGSPSHWAKTVRESKGRPVVVTILRDHQEHTFTLIPDSKKRSALDLPGSGPSGASVEPVVWTAADVVVLRSDEL